MSRLPLSQSLPRNPNRVPIVIFSSLLVGAGGAERLAFEEAEYLARAGFSSRLLTFAYHSDVRFGGAYDFPVEVIPVRRGPAGFFVAIWRLATWLRRVRPRLVIASSVIDCAYLRAPALIARVPYITHIHGSVFWFERDRTKYAYINRRALRRVLSRSPFHAEFVPARPPRAALSEVIKRELLAMLFRLGARGAVERITLSRRTACEVELLYGKPARDLKGAFPRRLLDYRGSLDPFDALGLAAGPKLLNVNRLEPRKRVDVAIAAFARVLRTFPTANLVIGGTGPSEAELRRLAESLGIGSRVHFVGFISERHLLEWLAHCDVFVHPNWAEFAIAPYEALAMGRKVVWSTEMEMDDTIAATNLVYPADPTVEATAAALVKAVRSSAPGPNSRALMETYTWERYFESLTGIVSDVMSRT